jgi:molybdopterin-guanine dinucleotide biosynthesis protein A
MIDKDRTTGLILAGGAGRRVQGQDKGLMLWRGKPLVEHVAVKLGPQVGRLVISCNRNAEIYARFAQSLIGDYRTDFQGPLAGIEAAATTLQSEYLIVVACDTPRMPADLVSRLLAPLVDSGPNPPVISYANDGIRDHYLCAAIHQRCLASLPDFLESGQRAVRHWYRLHRSVAVDFSAQASAFINHNYPDTDIP